MNYLPWGDESSPRGRWSICAPALPEVLTFLPRVFQSGRFLEIFFKMSKYTIIKKIHLQHLGEKHEFSKFSTLAWEMKRPFPLSYIV
jgi:hypothetical protein